MAQDTQRDTSLAVLPAVFLLFNADYHSHSVCMKVFVALKSFTFHVSESIYVFLNSNNHFDYDYITTCASENQEKSKQFHYLEMLTGFNKTENDKWFVELLSATSIVVLLP